MRPLIAVTITAALLAAACGSDRPAARPTPEREAMPFADLRAAAFAAVDCIRSEGVKALEPAYDRMAFRHAFMWERSPRADRIGERCVGRRYEPASARWQRSRAAEIASHNREFKRLMGGCLASAAQPQAQEVRDRCAAGAMERMRGSRP